MPLVATQEGCLQLWQQILGIGTIGYPYCHLFGSAHPPAHTDTYSTYAAIELSVGGYSPILLGPPPANWTLATVPAGAQATYKTLLWALTGACSVYGYWISNNTNSYSLWAEQFAAPYVFTAGGGPFSLILPPTLTSQP